MTPQELELYATLFQKLGKDFAVDLLNLHQQFGHHIYDGRDPREVEGFIVIDHHDGWGGVRKAKNTYSNCFFHTHIGDGENDYAARSASWPAWGAPAEPPPASGWGIW